MSTCPTCNKTDCDELVRCDICCKKAFCGDECCTMGWSIHEGVCNVITVPKRDMTVMVPYYGEDMMDAEVLDKLPKSSELFQSHIVRYVDPKGIVEQHVVIGGCLEPVVQETLGGGGEPTPSQMSMMYEVQIYSHDDGFPDQLVWEGKRKVGKTVISKKSENKNLQALAKRSIFPRDYMVLNPTIDEKIDKRVKRSGFLKVAILGPSGQEYVDASYDIQYTKTREMFRNVRRLFQKGQAAHLKQFNAGNQHLLFMRARNNTGGASVLLTFAMNKVEGGSVSEYVDLLDVEVAVSARTMFKAKPSSQNLSPQEKALVKTMKDIDRDKAPTSPPYDESESQIKTQYPFRCDPSSLEHVTALVMAMEDWMGHGELQSASVQAHFDTINTYRNTMEEALLRGDDPQTPSPKINAAINSATQEVWELVEARGRLRRWAENTKRKVLNEKGIVVAVNKVRKHMRSASKQTDITQANSDVKMAVEEVFAQVDAHTAQSGEGRVGENQADAVYAVKAEYDRPEYAKAVANYIKSLDDTGKTDYTAQMKKAVEIGKNRYTKK